MYRKIAAWLIILAMIPATGALAEETATIAENADAKADVLAQVTELSLEDAIKLGLDKNPQLEAADAKIRSSEFALETAKLNQKEFNSLNNRYSVAVDTANSMETAYLKHGYYPVAAQAAIDLAVMAKQQVESQINYNVTEKYFNVKRLEQLVEISRSSLQIANDNADIVKKQFELGLASKLEVQNVEASVESAAFTLESYKRNLELAAEGLKIAIQKEDSDEIFVLTDEIALPEMPALPDTVMEMALESRYDVIALKKAYELQEMYFNITGLYVLEDTSKYQSVYADTLSAKYTYENTAKQLALAIRNEYAAVLTAGESILSAQNALNVKQIEFDSNKIKYEMGLITNLQLTTTMAELENCKVQLENANLSYMLAVEKYNYDITIGI
ncbi:MAG: TolC family protein [Clostridia bacterium]|nr:TolC family protein [Clostridia bacterium]